MLVDEEREKTIVTKKEALELTLELTQVKAEPDQARKQENEAQEEVTKLRKNKEKIGQTFAEAFRRYDEKMK